MRKKKKKKRERRTTKRETRNKKTLASVVNSSTEEKGRRTELMSTSSDVRVVLNLRPASVANVHRCVFCVFVKKKREKILKSKFEHHKETKLHTERLSNHHSSQPNAHDDDDDDSDDV